MYRLTTSLPGMHKVLFYPLKIKDIMMLILTKRLNHTNFITTTATLDLNTRLKSRAQINLDDGRKAGILLQRGSLLRDNELLTNDDHSEIIKIIAAAERVSTVFTNDALLLARICYHLGNRHVPLQITASWIRYQCDHVLDDMVRRLGATVSANQAPFEPEAGSYQRIS